MPYEVMVDLNSKHAVYAGFELKSDILIKKLREKTRIKKVHSHARSTREAVSTFSPDANVTRKLVLQGVV